MKTSELILALAESLSRYGDLETEFIDGDGYTSEIRSVRTHNGCVSLSYDKL